MSKKKHTDRGTQASHDDGVANASSEYDREQQALRKKSGGLIGDTDQNRNLTGSSTWETLPEPPLESKRSRGHH